MDSVEPVPRTKRRTVLQALALGSALAILMQRAFIWLAPRIHGATPPPNLNEVTGWTRSWLLSPDGLEMPVMAVATTGVFFLSLVLTAWWVQKPRPGFLPVEWALVLGALWLLSKTQTYNFTPPATTTAMALNVGAVLLAAALGLGLTHVASGRRWLAVPLAGAGVAALALAVVCSARQPAVYDYGFFIAPALKLAQGEPLGSFYMQYNLIGTGFVRLLMAAKLQLHHMQAAFLTVFALWFLLYAWLARHLIEARSMRVLFMVALVVVRFVGIEGGPGVFPQVGSLRMDLWVPLVLVLARFGYASPVTATAFALGYVADNSFGALFAGFYVGALALQLLVDWRAGRRPSRALLAKLLAPVGLAVLFQFWAFGGLTNPATKAYQSLHISFMPIEPLSMFWMVLWALLAAVGPLLLDPDARRRGVSLFLFAVSVTMLTYFYGRSHDHNLMNISGIWVTVIFVALDRLRSCGLPRWFAPALAVALLVFAAWGTGLRSQQKFDVLAEHWAQRRWNEPSDYDVRPDLIPFLRELAQRQPKIFIFGTADAYLNYRAGLVQQGYFAPFYASVFLEPTAAYVRDLLDDGFVVLLLDADLYGAQSLMPTQAFAGREVRVAQNGPFKQLLISPKR